MTAILPADMDAEWLMQWCQPREAECSPIEAVFLDACPVVFDPAQYERARRLGLAGRLASVLVECVVFDGPRFRLAQHCEDQAGAQVAFLFPVEDSGCEIADVAAWVPETGRVGTLIGRVGTLGLPSLAETWLEPPMVFEAPLEWLLAPRGLCVIEPELAAIELEGMTLACPDRGAAARLHSRLAPFAKRPLQIMTPRKAA